MYLARCLTHIDLNMVRAGVVGHPREWPEAGYREIQQPRQRYRIIDRVALCELLGVADAQLAIRQNEWIEARLAAGRGEREAYWSAAVAVGADPSWNDSGRNSGIGHYTGRSKTLTGRQSSATLTCPTDLFPVPGWWL